MALSRAADNGIVGLFDPIPAVVPVHGVVASHDRSDPADTDAGDLGLKLLQIGVATLGRGVATVKQAVNADLAEPFLFGQFQQRVQMGVVGVDAAVGEQAGEVKTATPCLCPGDAVQQDRVGEKIAVDDGFADHGQVLVHDPAGTEIEVADFRIAHLPFRQADRHSRGEDAAMGVLRQKLVQVRGIGQADGIGG